MSLISVTLLARIDEDADIVYARCRCWRGDVDGALLIYIRATMLRICRVIKMLIMSRLAILLPERALYALMLLRVDASRVMRQRRHICWRCHDAADAAARLMPCLPPLLMPLPCCRYADTDADFRYHAARRC